jgi:hypothetical protein
MGTPDAGTTTTGTPPPAGAPNQVPTAPALSGQTLPQAPSGDIAIDANTAMIFSDQAPYAHNFNAAKKATTRDWKAVWAYSPSSSTTTLLTYLHGNEGLVTVAHPSNPPQYIYQGTVKPPNGGTLAPANNKGLYPVFPADGILPSFWGTSSCSWNLPIHLKQYGSLYYPAVASSAKYRIDGVVQRRSFVALIPEVGRMSGNGSIASSFQLGAFFNGALTQFGGSGIVNPVNGTPQTFSVPVPASIKTVLIVGHSAGGGVLKQLQKDSLFTTSGAIASGTALSVAVGNLDGMYGSWKTGYGVMYKTNTQLRIWLINLASADLQAVLADFKASGIGQRELDDQGNVSTTSVVNKKTAASGLYLYTMNHQLGKNDTGVQSALANSTYRALFVQTNTQHDQLPNRFIPWMADAL